MPAATSHRQASAMSMLQLRCCIWRRCITRDRRIGRASACLSSSSASPPEQRAALPLLAKLEPAQRQQVREPRRCSLDRPAGWRA